MRIPPGSVGWLSLAVCGVLAIPPAAVAQMDHALTGSSDRRVPSAPQSFTQANGRSVYGWRLGLYAGGYDIRGGGFPGRSTGAGGSLGLDYLGRSGWGIGVAADGSFQDPLGKTYFLNTYRASIRYSNVGHGGGYYQYLGLDGVAGSYRWDRTSDGMSADTSAFGIGLGPSIGVGGYVGGGSVAMEISVGYSFLWFRDAKVGGTTIAGSSVQTNLLRFVVGLWIG